jgi:L-cysteine desulfidase
MPEKDLQDELLALLKAELVPAVGCTEPIAIAFAAAVARRVFGRLPDSVYVHISPSLYKNARRAAVPGTQGLAGVAVAAIAGLVAGRPDHGLRVLETIDASHLEEIRRLVQADFCNVEVALDDPELSCTIRMTDIVGTCEVEIHGAHSNIVRITRDGIPQPVGTIDPVCDVNRERILENVIFDDLYAFSEFVPIASVRRIIEPQIECNMHMVDVGLSTPGSCGLAAFYQKQNDTVLGRMKAATAAAIEARMGGAAFPVYINSGSGNQGISVSVPVIVYARDHAIDEERLIRALVLSNLAALLLKSRIGTLSPFCGAISAVAAAAAAMVFLDRGPADQAAEAMTNTLAIAAGIVCDGAKPSCAAKAALALDAAATAYDLATEHRSFQPGTGIVGRNPTETVVNVGRLAREGMVKVDRTIVAAMCDEDKIASR